MGHASGSFPDGSAAQPNPVRGAAGRLSLEFSEDALFARGFRFLAISGGSPNLGQVFDFGRVGNRSWRKPGEESPNTTGRDAA